jgi:hypothetical protein
MLTTESLPCTLDSKIRLDGSTALVRIGCGKEDASLNAWAGPDAEEWAGRFASGANAGRTLLAAGQRRHKHSLSVADPPSRFPNPDGALAYARAANQETRAPAKKDRSAFSTPPLGPPDAKRPPRRRPARRRSRPSLLRTRGGLRRIPLFDRTFQSGPGHRAADEIALGAVTADTIQEVEYFLCFDAFGASR